MVATTPADIKLETTMEDIWEGFVEQCMPWANDPDAQDQVEQERTAFFAGALAVIGWVNATGDDPRFASAFLRLDREVREKLRGMGKRTG
jgi:hypothetical protein